MLVPALVRGQRSHQEEYARGGCQEGHRCQGELGGDLWTWMVCVIFCVDVGV